MISAQRVIHFSFFLILFQLDKPLLRRMGQMHFQSITELSGSSRV